MNVLKSHKKLAILSALVEGCSVRAAARLANVEKKTVLRLLTIAGKRCQAVLDEKMLGLRCEAVECDEIWGCIGMKDAHVKPEQSRANPELGDVYTFVAFDPSTKLVISFFD
jgi:hypothetical protein